MQHPVADAHCDTLTAWVEGKQHAAHLTAERLAAGNVRLQLFALFALNQGVGPQALAHARAQLARFPDVCAACALDVADDALAGWPHRRMAMLSLEGGEIVQGSLSILEEFLRAGVRVFGLTWNHDNELGHACKTEQDKGLTAFGRQVIAALNARGVAADVAHASAATFWDALEASAQPIICTHTAAHDLHAHPRNLNNAQIRALAHTGGYIGVCFYPPFLAETGALCTAQTVADHIDHIAQIGGGECVGLGSDFDGIGETPADLPHPGLLGNLFAALEKRGYSGGQIAGIAGENLVRYLRGLRG